MAILGDVILEWPFRGLRIKGRHFRMAILGEVICENVRMAIEEIKLALTPYWGGGPFWPTWVSSPATWVGGYPPPSILPDPGYDYSRQACCALPHKEFFLHDLY